MSNEPPHSNAQDRAWSRWALLVLLAVVVGGTLLRVQHIDAPFPVSVKGRCCALYSVVGRNHVRYGYRATELAMVTKAGQMPVEELADNRYVHHPPFVGVMTAESFRWFGAHEWSARLPALIASILSIVMLYVVCRSAAGTGVALSAAAIMAALPMAAFYGAFVDVLGSQILLASLVTFWLYSRWNASRRTSDLLGYLGVFLLSTTMDWPVYLLALALFLHHLVHPGPRGRSHAIWLLPLAVFGSFAAHLAVIHYHAGGTLGKLGNAFQAEHDHGIPLPEWTAEMWKTWLGFQWRNYERLYTTPIMVLTGGWILVGVLGALCRRVPRGTAIVMSFALMGFGYALMFPVGSAMHEYMTIFAIPAVSVAPALAIHAALRVVRAPRVRAALVVVFVGALVGYASTRTVARFDAESAPAEHPAYYIDSGRAAATVIPATATVTIAGFPAETAHYAFYWDRRTAIVAPAAVAATLAGAAAHDGTPSLAGIATDWLAVPRSPADHPIAAVRRNAALIRKLIEGLGSIARPIDAGPVVLFRIDRPKPGS